MKDLTKLIPFKRQGHSSLLGLTLDGSRLDGVVVRRTNGSVQLQQSFSATLTLDPLTAAPDLVAREIRNHLDAAEVRERHCVVCVPLKWALTVHTELPDLPEADVASFLQIEAERAFHSDVATLQISKSRYRSRSNKQQATLIGLPQNHLLALEKVLEGAKLKPVSFSLGIPALQPPDADASNGVLALSIGEKHVDLQITCAGGIVALRTLEGVLETEGSRTTLHTELIAREMRITLGQLPEEFRESVRRVRIFGPRDLAQQLADELELRLEPLGLTVELVTGYAPGEFTVQLPKDAPVSAAFSLTVQQLSGRKTPFEFLPPKVSQWEQFANRYAAGRYRSAIATAGAVVLLVLLAFLVQQIQLMRLNWKWKAMSKKVEELEAVQGNIRKFRPWFDDSFRCLSIMKQVTMAFPDDSAVSAKTLEVRDENVVTCSGVARDNASFLRTLTQLRAANGVSDLKVDMIRGKSPLQFTFDFRWNGGGRNEN
jgi:hypothetical protein